MKKLGFLAVLLSLAACGPSHEEMVKLVEDEYSVLDCDILKVEQDLLTQMIEEEERSLAKANAVNFAIGLISIVATGSGSFSGADNKDLDKYKLRLEAINNLVKDCPK
jgi:hypothetical protein